MWKLFKANNEKLQEAVFPVIYRVARVDETHITANTLTKSCINQHC